MPLTHKMHTLTRRESLRLHYERLHAVVTAKPASMLAPKLPGKK